MTNDGEVFSFFQIMHYLLLGPSLDYTGGRVACHLLGKATCNRPRVLPHSGGGGGALPGQYRPRPDYQGDWRGAGALPLAPGGAASHRRLDQPSACPTPQILLRPLCTVPSGLSAVADGASGGGRQGGGGQEEGLDSPGLQEMRSRKETEAFHSRTRKGLGRPRTLGTSSRVPTDGLSGNRD